VVVGDLALFVAAGFQLGTVVGRCIGEPPIGVALGLPFKGVVGFEEPPPAVQPLPGARPDKLPAIVFILYES